jgi:YVTN family beta-propeller protein
VNPFKSPVCLKCHTTASDSEDWQRDETFSFSDGIQCEYCHGPGSEYMDAKIMADPKAAMNAGLIMPDEDFCLMCHMPKGSHDMTLKGENKGKSFKFQSFMAQISHKDFISQPDIKVDKKTIDEFKAKQNQIQEKKQKLLSTSSKSSLSDNSSMVQDDLAVEYKTPFNLTFSHDGKYLYVVCEGSDSLIVIDTLRKTSIQEIKVQNQPHGVCLSENQKQIFVSNRGSDSVTVIDAKDFQVMTQIPVGDEPHGLITDAKDRYLFVANAGSYDISVVDLQTFREVKRLSAGRGTWAMRRSPDNRQIYVTNNLSHYVPFRTPSRSEVTVIDCEKAIVTDRFMVPESNLIQGVDFVPDGEFALVTSIRTKNLIPMTRVTQGWVITNGMAILWKDGRIDQLLLDEVDRYFADPTDLVITPDGKYAFISSSGIDEIAMVDLEKMIQVLKTADDSYRQEILPNHLGVATEYVLKRIPVGRSPRGLAISPDGKYLYAADALDDTVSVIDIDKQAYQYLIDLGGPKEITMTRTGERIFHNAQITFGQQFSCHTCHPDGGIDGITYDIEPDGLGINPVDNRTLRGILDTAPFKWTGKNPTLSRQCGPRLAVFFTRIDPFTPEQVIALERYICTIPRNPNRYLEGSRLTAAQRRGKVVFDRTHDNMGNEIPKTNRCNYCHSGPYFTNRKKMDVGTASHLDTHSVFDVPHLNNIYETSPFLHDGRSDTLEEIWTIFNPDDLHGVTNDMTKDQLNDLIEYLKTL